MKHILPDNLLQCGLKDWFAHKTVHSGFRGFRFHISPVIGGQKDSQLPFPSKLFESAHSLTGIINRKPPIQNDKLVILPFLTGRPHQFYCFQTTAGCTGYQSQYIHKFTYTFTYLRVCFYQKALYRRYRYSFRFRIHFRLRPTEIQLHSKDTSHPRFALHTDTSAHVSDNHPCNRHPQAAPLNMIHP